VRKEVIKERHIARGTFFMGENVNVTLASWKPCSRLQQSRRGRYWFLLHTPQQWLTVLFNGLATPKIAPSPWRCLPHVRHGSLGQPQSASKRSVQSFLQGSRMCPTDRQTCRQTTLLHL